MTTPEAQIVLVDDDDVDITLFRRLCDRHGVQAEISVATSGDMALDVLRRRIAGKCGRQVVITDLNMPGLNGHELIEEIRNDERLADSIIFVMSSSEMPDDIERAYQQHVAGYIVKDHAGDRLEAGIGMLSDYFRAVTIR